MPASAALAQDHYTVIKLTPHHAAGRKGFDKYSLQHAIETHYPSINAKQSFNFSSCLLARSLQMDWKLGSEFHPRKPTHLSIFNKAGFKNTGMTFQLSGSGCISVHISFRRRKPPRWASTHLFTWEKVLRMLVHVGARVLTGTHTETSFLKWIFVSEPNGKWRELASATTDAREISSDFLGMAWAQVKLSESSCTVKSDSSYSKIILLHDCSATVQANDCAFHQE